MAKRPIFYCSLTLAFILSAQNQWRTCIRVVDGDTIVLDGNEKVRLIGIDSPELNDSRATVRQLAEKCYEFARSIIEGRRVRLEYDQDRVDKYGRTLAYIYLENGTFINAEMVKQGFAYAYVKYPFKHMDDFRRYEQEARQNSRGLWAGGIGGSEAIEKTASPASVDSKTIVYITRSGTKYHTENCRSLSKSKIPITLGEAIQKGYTPCSICKPPVLGQTAQKPQPSIAEASAADITVYVTRTGSKYHTATCSSLRRGRTPMSLKDACAAGYTPCSRCNPPKCK
jgi:micrococcal nuclease